MVSDSYELKSNYYEIQVKEGLTWETDIRLESFFEAVSYARLLANLERSHTRVLDPLGDVRAEFIPEEKEFCNVSTWNKDGF